MNNKTDSNNSAFCYSVNMLRLLHDLKLITQDEYNRIIAISAAHYDTKIYCV